MKILIVGPGFFGYAEALSKEMRVRGHSVKFIHERGNESFLVKLIFRVGILRKVFWPVVRYFQFMILQTAKQYEPTHVLFVSPDAMSSYLVNGLKLSCHISECICGIVSKINPPVCHIKINLISLLPLIHLMLKFTI